MALIEDEHVVQALGPDRSHPALGNCVGPRRSERRARLGNTEITYPPIEAGSIAAVAVMNEKAWRLAVPTATFDNLLSGPRGGRMPVGRKNRSGTSCGLLIDVMEASKHWYCNDLYSLSASMRRTVRAWAIPRLRTRRSKVVP
jgi:hypothetical protein